MRWKYDSDKCVCGETEDENHILWVCMEYEERNEWLRKWNTCKIALNGGGKGCVQKDKCIVLYAGV